jgi:hypothetical protein
MYIWQIFLSFFVFMFCLMFMLRWFVVRSQLGCWMQRVSHWVYWNIFNERIFTDKGRFTYTTQILPKTVAFNLLTTWVVLCKSSAQLAYNRLGVVRLIYTVRLTL